MAINCNAADLEYWDWYNRPMTVKKESDIISSPAHYCYSKYEPKDVIREWNLNFNLGSAVKYIARAGRKDDIIQDLRKAKQFIEFEIGYLEEERKKENMDD